MGLWDYCAVCGKQIETGELCIGVKECGEHLFGDSICLECAKIENLPGWKKPVSITDLLTRAEAAEARAEKAEGERDAAVSDLETVMAYGGGSLDTCQFCKNGQCYKRGGAKPCLPKWRGQKEE